jgi:hypothetical protein
MGIASHLQLSEVRHGLGLAAASSVRRLTGASDFRNSCVDLDPVHHAGGRLEEGDRVQRRHEVSLPVAVSGHVVLDHGQKSPPKSPSGPGRIDVERPYVRMRRGHASA